MKKKISLIICAVLSLAAALFTVKLVIDSYPMPIMMLFYGFLTLAMLSMFFYCVLGGSKKQKSLYKIALLFWTVSLILNIVFGISGSESGIPKEWEMAYCILGILCMSVLLFSADLGKIKTYVFHGIIIAIQVADLCCLAVYWSKMDESVKTSFLSKDITSILLSVLLLICAVVKYADKKERYTVKRMKK